MAIVNPGDSQQFNYTGGMQSITIPYNGIYKLEVWGGKGGNGEQLNVPGGYGGYSIGYKSLKSGTVLYICCGGGNNNTYNGGGSASNGVSTYGGHGGGATHIALVNGVLSSIGYTSFVTNGNGLIVAGGGGGGGNTASKYGGTGGGLIGGEGICWGYNSTGGTQTAGGTTFYGNAGSFGQGGNAPSASISYWLGGGGGGGLFGGGSGQVNEDRGKDGAGAGGSGYIGGVPSISYKGTTYSPSTSNGVNSGNGYAKITLMTKTFPTLYYNNTQLTGINYNGVDVTDIYYNGTLLS